jgi:hypothetical protein
MISRVTMRKSGLAEYLEKGKRADSNLLRNDKDNVLPLYGSLTSFKKAEQYCNRYKEWKHNYEHLTISFSKEDSEILDGLDEEDYQERLKDITLLMIKHRTSGYDIDNEVIAYAELHDPKIEYNSNPIHREKERRYKHIHIAISYLNPLSDTKLQTTFYNNSYISDTIDKFIAKRHGLTYATVKEPVIDKSDRAMSINRQELKRLTKDFLTQKELFKFFDRNNIRYGFTNKNSKVKQSNVYVLNEKGGKIHLRGRDFPNIEIMMNLNFNEEERVSHIKGLKDKSLQELEKILERYYKENRIPLIDNRRGQEAKEYLKEIYRQSYSKGSAEQINSFSSFQEKIFYKHYHHLLSTNLKGYYVDTQKGERVTFSHKAKEIEVYDEGNLIRTDGNSKNLEEKVGLMLDIALAKKWNLHTLEIKGSKYFKKEAYRQIAERIQLEKRENGSLHSPLEEIERPISPTQYLAKENQEKKKKNEALKALKSRLSAQRVLSYAIKVYELDGLLYEVANDNKIKSLLSRAKPKNIIDFLQKELSLSSKEAIGLCQKLDREDSLKKEQKVKSKRENIRERQGMGR